MVTELRDYRIRDGHLDRFVEAWARGVRPLRERDGFTIDGAWKVIGESRFVWLLSREGGWDEFDRANDAYYTSSERLALDPDPAQWVVEARHHRLLPITGPPSAGGHPTPAAR